jgi:DNA-binding protein HU-beta
MKKEILQKVQKRLDKRISICYTFGQFVLFLDLERRRERMTKNDLISEMAKRSNISKAAANAALDTFTDSIKRALKKGEKVTLVGFGTFSTAKRKARTGRNPRTGEILKIKARRVPKFSPGKSMKDLIE